MREWERGEGERGRREEGERGRGVVSDDDDEQ